MRLKIKSRDFLTKKLKKVDSIWIEFQKNGEIEASFNIKQEFSNIAFMSFDKNCEVIEQAYFKKGTAEVILFRILKFAKDKNYKKISLYQTDNESLLILDEK